MLSDMTTAKGEGYKPKVMAKNVRKPPKDFLLVTLMFNIFQEQSRLITLTFT